MPNIPIGVLVSVGRDLENRLQRLREAGFETMQLVAPPKEYLAEPKRAELVQLIVNAGIRITSVAAVFAGESYANIEAVRKTVGLVPEETREARCEDIKQIAVFAHELSSPNVFAHIGFIPEDPSDPTYRTLVIIVQDICDHLGKLDLAFCLETGQETADLLKQFIGKVSKKNLGVNFDPANMIIYGAGDPIQALEILAPWVRGVHCKDGEWPKTPGFLGEEKILGQGQVGLARFLKKLQEVGYEGALTIEREISGEQQMQDILAAKALLEKTKAGLGIR